MKISHFIKSIGNKIFITFSINICFLFQLFSQKKVWGKIRKNSLRILFTFVFNKRKSDITATQWKIFQSGLNFSSFFFDKFNLIFLAKFSIFHPDFIFIYFLCQIVWNLTKLVERKERTQKYCLRHFDKKEKKRRIKGISSIYHSDIYTMI